MNQASPNPFLFCQLILRAFIESLYLIARTRTSGGQSFLRSLTYHRSLVVDRSTSSPIVKDRLFWCNERGTFKKVSGRLFSSSSRATIQSWASSIGVQSWEKGRVESPSRLAPSPASTPQSQSFVKKGGLLLILSPALERPDKQSLDWEMCQMEVFLIVDVLTHDPLIEIYDPPWGRGLFFPSSEDHNSSFSHTYSSSKYRMPLVTWRGSPKLGSELFSSNNHDWQAPKSQGLELGEVKQKSRRLVHPKVEGGREKSLDKNGDLSL